MRHFNTIAMTIMAALFLTVGPALAQNKFKNEDTAKNRQDNVFGTEQTEETTSTTIGKDENGDNVIRSKPAPKVQVDWYDKIDMGLDMEMRLDPDDY